MTEEEQARADDEKEDRERAKILFLEKQIPSMTENEARVGRLVHAAAVEGNDDALDAVCDLLAEKGDAGLIRLAIQTGMFCYPGHGVGVFPAEFHEMYCIPKAIRCPLCGESTTPSHRIQEWVQNDGAVQ